MKFWDLLKSQSLIRRKSQEKVHIFIILSALDIFEWFQAGSVLIKNHIARAQNSRPLLVNYLHGDRRRDASWIYCPLWVYSKVVYKLKKRNF